MIGGLTVSAEDQSENLFGTLVSDMQSNVTVSNGAIKGTLKFIEGGIAESGPLAGDGYFLALKFSDPDESATSLKVGLNPSKGTGLVELDEDMNAVFKITDKNRQVLNVVSSNATSKNTQIFSLNKLKLSDN